MPRGSNKKPDGKVKGGLWRDPPRKDLKYAKGAKAAAKMAPAVMHVNERAVSKKRLRLEQKAFLAGKKSVQGFLSSR